MKKKFVVNAMIGNDAHKVWLTKEMAEEIYGEYQKELFKDMILDAADKAFREGRMSQELREKLEDEKELEYVVWDFAESLCSDYCRTLDAAKAAVDCWIENSAE